MLLIDARDRIGGRTWTSINDGFPFELGGAWFHWNQPHVFSQLSRYNLADELNVSFDVTGGIEKTSLNYEEGAQETVTTELSDMEQELMYEKLGAIYFNIDGALGRNVMPYPHMPWFNPAVREFDKLSAFDRVEEIREDLTELETNALKSYLLLLSGGTPKTAGFLSLLHWWMLRSSQSGSWGTQGEESYKLKHGTTSLARRLLADGLQSGNIDLVLSEPVAKVSDAGDRVTVTVTNGKTFTATKVISTIPLNVLKTVEFSPPLSTLKIEAIHTGHTGFHSKVHFEAAGTSLRSWSGHSYPGHGLLFAYGDEITPKGNTHIAAFGASTDVLHGENNIENIQKALLHLRSDIDIQRVLFHDWCQDPYSRGSWSMYPKGFLTKYLSALQERHGNVWFASSDWADGWTGFIDGAIEQGTRAAQSVADALLARR